jgi:ubiquinone/menaquinone biosynthesis C-methylase UbiE
MFSGDNVDIVGDVLNMPFEDDDFDTVICNQVLEHVKEPEKLFSETFRVLKKGGNFICTAPFLEPNHADPEDYFRYTKEALALMAERRGFKVLNFGSYGSFPIVAFSFIRFKFFNPYKKHSRIKKTILKILAKIAYFFSRRIDTGIIYSDSYLIAEK